MVEASSNWTFLTDIARATPCVCGASKGSAFSAEVVVSAAVLVDLGGDIRASRASGGFRASRGGGGGRLLSPRGVGIVLRPREAVCGRAKLLPLSVNFAATAGGAAESGPVPWQRSAVDLLGGVLRRARCLGPSAGLFC